MCVLFFVSFFQSLRDSDVATYLKMSSELLSVVPFHSPLMVKFASLSPEQTEAIAQRIRRTPLDFTVGSVHFIDDFAFDHKPELWQGIDVDHAYRRFFEHSAALAESGLFDGIAHPDSVKLFGHKSTFSLDETYDALAAALAKSGMYAEQNSGISRRTSAEPGMASALYAAMKRHNVPIRTASDAHTPADTGAGIRYFYDKHLV